MVLHNFRRKSSDVCRFDFGYIFEKSKNHDISVAVEAISTKFGTVMQFNPLERSNR